MFRIVVEQTLAMKEFGFAIIYGKIENDENLCVGDILVAEEPEGISYLVFAFPSIRRAEYKENHIDIGIKPVSKDVMVDLYKKVS